MADERYPDDRYSNEDEEYNRRDEDEDEENDEEEYEDIEEGSGKGKVTGFLILFIILFIVSTGLLAYFQFYQPNGDFKLTFDKRQVTSQQVDQMKKSNNQLQNAVDSLKAANQKKLAVIDSLSGDKDTTGKASSTGNRGGASISGTYYKVQIGAFESFSFDRYGDKVTNLTFEEKNGVLKLTLGRFKEANAARAFRRDLVEIGLEGAFVAKMRNGKRLKIIKSF
jgi:hypothetical protein